MQLAKDLGYGLGAIVLVMLLRSFRAPLGVLLSLVWRLIIGGVVVWGINLLGAHLGGHLAVHFGINPWTAGTVGLLGLPGVALLFAVHYAL